MLAHHRVGYATMLLEREGSTHRETKVRHLDRRLGNVNRVVTKEEHVAQRKVAVDELVRGKRLHRRAHLLKHRNAVPSSHVALDSLQCLVERSHGGKLHHQKRVGTFDALPEELHEAGLVLAQLQQHSDLCRHVARVHLQNSNRARLLGARERQRAAVHALERTARADSERQADGDTQGIGKWETCELSKALCEQ